MRIDVLTLFPEMFNGILEESIIKNAIEKKLVEINFINFRDFSLNKHRKVDDYAFSGGAGMVLQIEPIDLALKSLKYTKNSRKILLSPQGKMYTQQKAYELSSLDHVVLICGHYEGFDERITMNLVDEELSIGDYVLTGGEIPAMVIIDSISRLVEGVIKEESHMTDSFNNNLLEYPQYTRPSDYNGMKVPEILLSGHQKNINEYKAYESVKKTLLKRPDLVEKFNDEQLKIMLKILEDLSKHT